MLRKTKNTCYDEVVLYRIDSAHGIMVTKTRQTVPRRAGVKLPLFDDTTVSCAASCAKPWADV